LKERFKLIIDDIMATAAVQLPNSIPTYSRETTQTSASALAQNPQDVETILNYYKPNDDGSPPHPTYVDRPETYDRPVEPHKVVVRDVSGSEKDYTLDRNGFQFYKHTSIEKKFLDDEEIRSQYYPETERLLKDA
jgi:hypothetical protein